jgi:excinuclease ABC subunit C
VSPLDLKEKVKWLPESPGVYKMKDSSGNIIYVGKSKNLKNRVSQYFQSSRNHAPKIVKMVQCIRDFEYISTDTEFEALLLECRLIKEIQPMFNSQMKNHRKYVYLKITIDEEYPRILVSHEITDEGSLYFGPYTSLNSVERAASAIRDNFKIGNCSGTSIAKSSSGCLNYQMGLCLGPCVDSDLKREYMKRINETIAFLSGKDSSILGVVDQRMQDAAERLDFDKAAKYRDDIFALNHIINKQRVISFTQRTRNILALENIDEAIVKIFLLNDSRLLYEEKLEVSNLSKKAYKTHMKDIIKKYFRPNTLKQSKKINKYDIDQAQIVFSYLQNSKDCLYCLVPYSWLNEKGAEKLEKGLDKFIEKLF